MARDVLGEHGATAYVTGRSVRGQPTTDNLPGCIEHSVFTDADGRRVPPFIIREPFVDMVKKLKKQSRG